MRVHGLARPLFDRQAPGVGVVDVLVVKMPAILSERGAGAGGGVGATLPAGALQLSSHFDTPG